MLERMTRFFLALILIVGIRGELHEQIKACIDCCKALTVDNEIVLSSCVRGCESRLKEVCFGDKSCLFGMEILKYNLLQKQSKSNNCGKFETEIPFISLGVGRRTQDDEGSTNGGTESDDRTEAPTDGETEETDSPTQGLTRNPTVANTLQPTASAREPTEQPTSITAQPTAEPTIITVAPSMKPTFAPSSRPTETADTASPSVKPTITSPISVPSTSPSVNTDTPTSAATSTPAPSTLKTPTLQPSLKPKPPGSESTKSPTVNNNGVSKSPTSTLATFTPTVEPSEVESTNSSSIENGCALRLGDYGCIADDSALIAYFSVFISLLLIISILILRRSRRSTDAEKAAIGSFLSVFLAIFDFTSDLLLVAELLGSPDAELQKLGLVSAAFVAIPVLANMGLLVIVSNRIVQDALIYDWIEKNTVLHTCIMCLGLVSIEAYALCAAGCIILTCPMKKENVYLLRVIGFLNNIIEDIPQIIIALIVSSKQGWSPFTTISFITSVCSLVFSLLFRTTAAILYFQHAQDGDVEKASSSVEDHSSEEGPLKKAYTSLGSSETKSSEDEEQGDNPEVQAVSIA